MPAKNEAIRADVLKVLKDAKHPISRGDIAANLGCEAHTLPLKQMKDEGTITQHGERGAAKYTYRTHKPTFTDTKPDVPKSATPTKSKKPAV